MSAGRQLFQILQNINVHQIFLCPAEPEQPDVVNQRLQNFEPRFIFVFAFRQRFFEILCLKNSSTTI